MFLRFNRVSFVRCTEEFSDGRKEVLCSALRNRVRLRLEGVVSLRFDCEPSCGRRCRSFALAFSFPLTESRTGTGDGCLFLLEPRASDPKHIKN